MVAKQEPTEFNRKVMKSMAPRKTQVDVSPRLASKLVEDHEDTYLTTSKSGGRKTHSRRSIQALSKPQKRGRA